MKYKGTVLRVIYTLAISIAIILGFWNVGIWGTYFFNIDMSEAIGIFFLGSAFLGFIIFLLSLIYLAVGKYNGK